MKYPFIELLFHLLPILLSLVKQIAHYVLIFFENAFFSQYFVFFKQIAFSSVRRLNFFDFLFELIV